MSVNDYDEDLYEAIQDLVDEGLLEEGTTAYGVAQQVIHTGYNSLTPKQRHMTGLQRNSPPGARQGLFWQATPLPLTKRADRD